MYHACNEYIILWTLIVPHAHEHAHDIHTHTNAERNARSHTHTQVATASAAAVYNNNMLRAVFRFIHRLVHSFIGGGGLTPRRHSFIHSSPPHHYSSTHLSPTLSAPPTRPTIDVYTFVKRSNAYGGHSYFRPVMPKIFSFNGHIIKSSSMYQHKNIIINV